MIRLGLELQDLESEDEESEEIIEEVEEMTETDPSALAEMQAQIDLEKMKLLASKEMLAEERQRIASDIERQAAELEAERKARADLAGKRFRTHCRSQTSSNGGKINLWRRKHC